MKFYLIPGKDKSMTRLAILEKAMLLAISIKMATLISRISLIISKEASTEAELNLEASKIYSRICLVEDLIQIKPMGKEVSIKRAQ